MKKYTLALVLMACLPVVSVGAYEYADTATESYTTVRPAKAGAYKTTKTTRKTGGYKNTITNNFYYAQPQGQYAQESSYTGEYPRRMARKSSGYARYDDGYDRDYDNDYGAKRKQVSQVKESYSSKERKYFLAHPFFQPLKGSFGSVTDFSYAKGSFKFDMLDASVMDIDTNSATYGQIISAGALDLRGKAETTQFAVKEDFSIGLSDSVALILMAQYDKTKVTFKDWSSGDASDSTSSSGINIFGIGVQDRFLDNDKWIAMLGGHFQHQKNVANIFAGEIKAGYKIDRTTIYGLARLRYIDITEGDTYGAYVKDDTGDYLMLSYDTDVSDLFNVEAGIGAFAVVHKDITLNGELVFGDYDWHDQLSLKGAIGWQPGDIFALNLYASTSLYDSASGKKRTYMNYDVNPEVTGSSSTLVWTSGKYKIKDYNEWKIGVQAILYF